MSDDTLQKISLVLADIVAPLDSMLQNPKEFKGLIEQIGWQLPPGVDELGMAAVNVGNIIDAIISIVDASPEEKADSDIMMGRYLTLLEQVIIFLSNIKDTIGAINTLTGVSEEYLTKTQIVDLLLVRIFDYLIIKYVQSHSYQTFTALQFLGIFEIQEFLEDATIFQSQHRRHTIYYDRLVSCLSDPGSVMSNVYGWGSANPDLNKLLINLAMILQGFGANVARGKLRRKREEQLLERAVPESDSDPMPAIDISLINGLGSEPLDVGLRTFGLRATTSTATDAGLGLIPYIKGSPEIVFPIFGGWSFGIKGSLEADGGVALLLRPDTGLDVKVDLLEEGFGSIVSGAELLLSFLYGRDDEPLNLFNIEGVGGLSIEKFKLGGGIGLVDSNDFDIIVDGELTGGKFELGNEKGDGFIAKILPEDGISALFDLGFTWSRKHGLVMRGSGGLEVQIPTHISLGPIEIQNLLVAIKIGSEGIPLELGANIGANLGPLQVVVENIGAKLNFSFSNTQSGNLGPLDLKPGFKPPTGVGLAIDTGVVKGGGYLYFDFDKEEYAGILELDLNGVVSIKAIGLITTKMPDGSKGFSLLLILTAEFGSPIQLGLGFTLSGVGGLLGLNRTMRLEVIATGIRDGGINSIMFPQNVIANAPRIISDLKKYFPVEEGTFLIGPMVKIGWGTPNLVTVSLGVIIEIPGDIAILGVLKVALPDEDSAIIVIQVNFMGAIEFDKKRLWFFAS
ncbi:MAG TPA: hypothetical protein ENG96_03455, partial [Gammaproteobacteria bacterium]|nr:hypothetical protein [Gammaproteobacteria bacterium]